jgi:hypothetical protein
MAAELRLVPDVEEIPCVQIVISMEVVDAAVEVIAPRAGDGVDHPSCRATVLCPGRTAVHAELPGGLHPQIDSVDASRG